MAGGTANRPGLVLPTIWKSIVCPASLECGGSCWSGEIPNAQPAMLCAGEFFGNVWSGPFRKLGGSLTALTVIVNVCAALVLTFGDTPEPLSSSVTLKVAVPLE